MIKKILLLFVLISGTAQSQILDKKVNFGLLFNANGTSLVADPGIGKISPDLAFGGSAFLRIRARAIYMEAEVGFTSHHVLVKPDIAGTNIESGIQMSGLDLSAIFGWRVVGIGRLGNFRIFTGYNYVHYSRVSVESNSSQVNDASISTGNSGIIGGLGVDLWKIVFNVKYIHGISNISSEQDQTIKSQCVSLSLGYKF